MILYIYDFDANHNYCGFSAWDDAIKAVPKSGIYVEQKPPTPEQVEKNKIVVDENGYWQIVEPMPKTQQEIFVEKYTLSEIIRIMQLAIDDPSNVEWINYKKDRDNLKG